MAMEFSVAIVLILLGISSLLRSSSTIRKWLGLKHDNGDLFAHSHPHDHEGITHQHPHAHLLDSDAEDEHTHASHLLPPDATRSRFAQGSHQRAFGVGLIHGLAGSAAIALLVLSAIPNPIWAVAYLAIFCFGTIVGMTLITTAIGLPVSLTAARLGGLNRVLLVGAGLLSLGFGLFLAYQIGFVEGLLSFGPLPS
jgi:high-affinity nickel-transport protein